MKYICLFLEAHQPKRLRDFRYQDIGHRNDYFWEERNRELLDRISSNSYIPLLRLLTELNVPITMSFSGILLEQLFEYKIEVIDLLKEYLDHTSGELVAETYYHSLSSIWNPAGFINEVKKDMEIKREIYGKEMTTFRNTEMIYSDNVDYQVREIGIRNILTEGTDSVVSKYNPNFKYSSINGHFLFLRNYQLSDDISFRFSNTTWNEYPLFADKYLSWLSNSSGDVINLFMDFETFGEHQRKETGIFEFLKTLVQRSPEFNLKFTTIGDASSKLESKGTISVPDYISWADIPRDLSAWTGNDLQRDAFEALKKLKNCVPPEIFGSLSTSDHLYYMSLGSSPDMIVHNYFNPYGSPYDAYIIFRNILEDLKLRYCNEKHIV